jgi:hypothetical protein
MVLHPIRFVTGRSRRTEINVYRGIGIGNGPFLAADCGESLIGLEHRARMIVIDHDRPEVLRGDIRRQMQLVGLAAIQRRFRSNTESP